MSPLKRILILDNDPDHLLFCTLVFERRGYEVRSSPGCSPSDLLQLLAAFRPDLIFLDHVLRGISAMEVMEILRASPQYADIPVVLFSAEENIASLAEAAGATAHLRKPFTIRRLLDLTHQFIP
jgi:CheY-like chemotaxis protein